MREYPAHPILDPRNADHPSAAVIPPQTPRRQVWATGPTLNQGNSPACMGFGWAGALIASPGGDTGTSRALGNALGRNIYDRMLHYPDSGPGDLGARIAMDRGLIDGHVWASSLADVRDSVIANGPVVLYPPWYDSMGTTRHGVVRVRPHANPSFHCLFLRGFDPAKTLTIDGRKRTGPAFLWRNSWGTSYGIRRTAARRLLGSGDAWIRAGDLDVLMSVYGYESSACIPLGRRAIDVAAVLAEHPDPRVS